MKITITGRGVQVHDNMRAYAEEKAGKLERYLDEMQRIEVVVSSQGDDKVVEMIAVPRRGQSIVGQASHEDPFAAIDLVVDKMYQQLHKRKEKRHDRRTRNERVPPPPDMTDVDEEEQLESYDEVVDKFSEQLEG